MFDLAAPWTPLLDWSTPAGEALQRLLDELSESPPVQITVFGSAPLQLALDGGFLSADVDVFSTTDLKDAIERAGLQKGRSEIYIEQCDEIVFSAAASWRERAFVHVHNNVTLTFPHPIDILVSKIKRLEPKDLNAFRLVLERTSHPTPEELIAALRRHVDLFRPDFDEERGGDAVANVQILWRELYAGRRIDVRDQIIGPALESRRQTFGLDAPDLKSELPDAEF
jgi:hypothetical protein